MGRETRIVSKDAEYEKKVRESFARQGLMRHLGAVLEAVRPGECEIAIAWREELGQQHGFFHAGVTGAIADSACGYAALSLMPAGKAVLTVEYKLNLLAPAVGERLVARGRVVRAGRTLTVCSAEVLAVRNAVETLCATSLSTIMAVNEKEGLHG